MKFDTVLAMAAGAVAYYMYKRVSDLEDIVVALAQGGTIQVDKASFDIAAQDVHNEDATFKFGFHK